MSSVRLDSPVTFMFNDSYTEIKDLEKKFYFLNSLSLRLPKILSGRVGVYGSETVPTRPTEPMSPE